MRKADWAILIIIIFTFGIGIYFYPQLPDKMPIHWNIQGEVDSYANKIFAIFLFPSINLLIFAFFLILPKIDPKKDNYQNFKKPYRIFRYAMHLFLAILYLLTIQYSLITSGEMPKYLEIDFIVPFSVSILIIIIGNYLGKIQDNYFVGIRTPWTLSSKEVWYKTHRLTGKLYVISGILGLVGSFFGGMISFLMLMVPLLASSVYAVIYSYLEYRKEEKQ